jgi:predicted lactoylglutathione lyase
MEQEFWMNLPSKDLALAKEFFIKLGFTINTHHAAPHMVSLCVGNKKVVLNLFAEGLFQKFIGGHGITDTTQSNEILFSISAQSPAEVDAMAKNAVDAGGILYGKPGYTDGWMYGCGFSDLDGHRWNVLFMDMSKMPKGEGQ